ncbi:inositol monophosphatase family protein [Oceaniglobus indicus]|uniref:inositol monophosphatase family protein n=1 Tax=Oceaniglobus indicus TaxID=2047749 RepID=UPI000C1A4193|nr:inositol monophosphatase family protein [Oceaniglobus indicus]
MADDNLPRKTEDALIALVRDVARTEIMPRFRNLGHGDIARKTTPDDLVTEADTAAEIALSAGVRAILPAARIVGEEAVSADAAVLDRIGGDLVVILDPVDGTWNFASGIAVFGVILAVTVRGRCIFGLLYDPVMDDWIMARPGGGAWFCRDGVPPRRLSVSPPADMADMTGLVPVFMFPEQARPAAATAMLGFRRTTTFRCSCHEYRLLAQGRVDFLVNGGIHAWDHSAGDLCVREAGGHTAMMDGSRYDATRRTGTLLSANTADTVDLLRATFGGFLQ